jgi:tripartite-type tricarboxylate transporter receptor subunit TctC
MMVAPAATPRAVVRRLNGELTGILALPEIRAEIIRLGMLTFDNLPVDALQDFVKSEIVRWGKIVQQAGLAGTS